MNPGDPVAFINPGGILDITDIPPRLGGMGALSIEISIALLGFFLACEVVRQNIKALEGNTSYSSTFMRVGLVLIALIGYNTLFNFPIKVVFKIENAVLSVQDFNDAVTKMAGINMAKESVTFLTSISVLTAWFASYFSRTLTGVLQTVQFILLAVLYFFGPMVLVASVFEPLRNHVESWFKAVVEVSMWTLLVRVLFRIMIQLGIFAALTQQDATVGATQLMQFTIVNAAFVILVCFAPMLAHRLVGGPGFGAVAAIVTTVISSRATALIKQGTVVAGAGAGTATAGAVGAGLTAAGGIRGGIQNALQRFLGAKGSKTDMRNVRDQSRLSQGGDPSSPSASEPKPSIKRDRT